MPLLALAALAVTHLLALLGAFAGPDERVFDRVMAWRNAMAAVRPADPGVVVHVDIDDTVRERLGTLPGDAEIASVMQTLAAVGTAAQAYDFVFVDQGQPREELAAAARAAGNVYVGLAINPSGPPEAAIIASDQAVRAASRGEGALNAAPDEDGVYRRLPLIVEADNVRHPGLALIVACHFLQVSPTAIVFTPGRSVRLPAARMPDGGRRDLEIPVDDDGALRLNFTGDWGSFKHYGFADVWRDGIDPTAGPMWQSALGGKIVMVADVSTGRADVGAIPVDPVYPLAGLHATAIHNIITGQFLAPAPNWWGLLTKLAAIGAAWLVAAAYPRWLWAGAAVLVLLVAGAGAALYVYAGLVTSILQPTFALAVFTLSVGAWRYIDESRERELTRRTFEAYFPPAVVARVLSRGTTIARSRRREITVLFSDICGFTARSSAMTPEEVRSFLSSYFTRMVEVAFEHGGTVDKFIGDGLMIFFNDPEEQPDHADRAVACALAMQAAARTFEGLEIRIGVHTGTALVGDMGSPQRLSYTAVGSTVNLASRLEGAAPPGGILVSAATAARLSDRFTVKPGGTVMLKGFDAPVEVYHTVA